MTSLGAAQHHIVAAVWAGDAPRVALLLDQEPKLAHVRDPFGRTLVDIAANQVLDSRLQYRQIVVNLVEAGAPFDIFLAARSGLIDHIRQLLATSPGLEHAVDGLGRTPLQRAALINGECAACDIVIDELLQHDVRLDAYSACVLGIPEDVSREVNLRPAIVDTYMQGGTPLLWAARPRRHHAAAKVIAASLLNAGAALDVRDTECEENTPLHHAASWADQVELVGVLLRAGADVDLLNADGKTALDIAVERGHTACAEMLALACTVSRVGNRYGVSTAA